MGLSPQSTWVTLPFWWVLSDIFLSCLIFTIFDLSALTWFGHFSALVHSWCPSLLWCVFLSSTSHTLEHFFFFFKDTGRTSWHTSFERNAKKRSIFFLYLCYLYIYLFQARRHLLYEMHISSRSTIYMHFVSFFSCAI